DSYLLDSSDPANVQRGIDLYHQALKLNPHNDKVLYSCAMALTRRGKPGDLEEAVELFNRLVGLNPNDMNSHYKLYETYRRLGREREAGAHLAKFQVLFEKGRRQTVENYQRASFADTPAIHLRFGQQALAQHNYDLAAREFRFALERDP